MAITVSGLVTALNNDLNASETATTLSLAIKSMLRWVSLKGRWSALHKSADFNLVSGTSSIAKPSDWHKLDNIRLNNGNYDKAPLKRLEGGYDKWLENRQNETSSNFGEPTQWAERGNNFYLDPVSGGTYTATLYYWSIHAISENVEDTTILFQDVFELAMVYALIAIYLDSKSRHEKAVYYYAQAEEKLNELRDGYEDKVDGTIQYKDE